MAETVVMGAARRGGGWSFALAAWFVVAWASAPATAEAMLPGRGSCADCNVVVVSIDTLRPDRLEPFGYERPTSPELLAIARRGLVFERAYSTSLATAEAHMSLFTSLYPSVHGVRTVREAHETLRPLPPGTATLASRLREQGYATGGFHHGGNVDAVFGFDQGFDVYRRAPFMLGQGWKATRDWLAEVAGQRFFLFLHTYHVHDPYMPEKGSRQRFAAGYGGEIVAERRELARMAKQECQRDPGCQREGQVHRLYWSRVDRESERDVRHLSDLYDAEISEVDRMLPRLLEAFDAMPGDTLVIFLSDHGEAFGEHDTLGHATLHEEVIRIPMLLLHPRAPELAGKRTRRPVSLMDVSPWILHWLDVEAPGSFQATASEVEPRDAAADVLAEYPARDSVALVRDGWKILLEGRGGPLAEAKARVLAPLAAELRVSEPERFQRVRLFDLGTDPDELHDLGPGHPRFEPMLRAALARVAENERRRDRLAPAGNVPAALPEDSLRQLRALGYVD